MTGALGPESLDPASTQAASGADKVVLRVIAVAQVLLCLVPIPMIIPAFFSYGGASANPAGLQIFLLFWFFGIVSAACLFTTFLWARLFALVWNAIILGAITYLIVRGPHTRTEWLLFVPPAVVTGYLFVSSRRPLAAAYRRFSNQQKIRQRALVATIAIAVLLLLMRVAHVASHTDAALIAKLSSNSEDTRCSAANELGARGRAAAKALPTLMAILGTTTCTQWGRDRLPEYIDSIGGLDPFIALMNNGSGRAQEKAAMQLMYGHVLSRRQTGRELTPELVTAYLRGVHDDDALVRGTSAEALGLLGAEAARAAPDLIGALGDSDVHVRVMAVGSLEHLHSIEGLRSALASPDPDVRAAAIEWQQRLDRAHDARR
jgi:hypothetical protein